MFINNYTYSFIANSTSILRSDGATIPNDPANSDYAQYLKWLADGNVTTPAPQPDMSGVIANYSNQVDALVANVYSNWTRFQQEYLNRQSAATAFANKGFTGDPGVWVTSFALAAKLDNKTAANLILSQAAALNGALAALASQRMRKYEIAACKTPTDALNTFNSIKQDIASIASQIS